MANRIQFRRDTLANWQRVNPVLMEGELALISTDPSKPGVYDSKKVGDGVHAFNDLEMLGYECLQELGDSTQFPVSQKVVSDNINRLENKINSNIFYNDKYDLNSIIEELYIKGISDNADLKVTLCSITDSNFDLNVSVGNDVIALWSIQNIELNKSYTATNIYQGYKEAYIVVKSLKELSRSSETLANIYTHKANNLAHSPIITSSIIEDLSSNDNIINYLSDNGYLFGGLVNPTDSPKNQNYNTFYLATEPGVYSNFASNIQIGSEGLYMIYHLQSGWYHKVIQTKDKTKNVSFNAAIKELYVQGSKPSDNLYIGGGCINPTSNQIELLIYKDGTLISGYYHSTDGEFNKVVKFHSYVENGINIYAVINEVPVTAISGLPYEGGGLLDTCYTLDNNGKIAEYLVSENSKKISSIIEDLNPKTKQWTISSNDINKYIKEFYIENANSLFPNGLYIERLVIAETDIRFWMKDSNNEYILKINLDFHKYFFANEADGSWKYFYKSNAITPIYLTDTTTNLSSRIGYIKFNFEEGWYASSGLNLQVDLETISNIDNSPEIKKMLSDDRQIVLLGDSHYGYPHPNMLCDVIQGLTGIKTFNLGFGGCRMAWRTSDGSNPFDVYTFPEIVDALVSQNFAKQEAQINIGMKYGLGVADLKAIDINKPIQILLHYAANDATGGTELGNIWQDDVNFDMTSEVSVNAKLASFNRQLFNEAFLYGIIKLYYNFTTKFNIQVLDEGWRWYETSEGKRTIIWNYTNDIGKKPQDYTNALKEGCKQVGIRYIEYYNCGIMNAFSLIPSNNTEHKTGIGLEGSVHLEPIGHAQFAYWLANQTKTYYL